MKGQYWGVVFVVSLVGLLVTSSLLLYTILLPPPIGIELVYEEHPTLKLVGNKDWFVFYGLYLDFENQTTSNFLRVKVADNDYEIVDAWFRFPNQTEWTPYEMIFDTTWWVWDYYPELELQGELWIGVVAYFDHYYIRSGLYSTQWF